MVFTAAITWTHPLTTSYDIFNTTAQFSWHKNLGPNQMVFTVTRHIAQSCKFRLTWFVIPVVYPTTPTPCPGLLAVRASSSQKV